MRNRYFLIADLPIIVLAALGAFVLRFDWFFRQFQYEFVLFVLLALAVKPVVFFLFGIYSRYWRYASVGDLTAVALAVATSTVVMALLVGAALLTHVIEQFARSVVLIDGLLTLVAIGGVRASVRVITESRTRSIARGQEQNRRVLVAGAGDAGAIVVREMLRNPQLGMVPIGFVDDDPVKQGKRIYELPVFGPIANVADVVRAQQIDEVIIAMPSAPGRTVRAVVEQCRNIGVPNQTMPGVYELLDGNVSVSRLRNVDIADLLRRSEVELKRSAGDYVAGRTVLVTGAGGSIGLELCRQVALGKPAALVLLGHGENSLYDAEAHLHQLFPQLKLRVVVADIRDRSRLTRVFRRMKPEIVFHAAAHKHVPMMEDNPEEAISNNVLGTRNVVNAALETAVQRLVLISSDKAVSPASLMGASKRLAEHIVTDAARRNDRAFVVVRFGNVLGSRGSVVPVFKQQIEQGGPVTITHPDMRRFFMTIPEAVHLVLEAGGMGKGGELFVLRMGEPVRIVDLAQDLIRLSGFTTDDIPIVYTSVRPGEKLKEALWEDGAAVATTRHEDVIEVRESDVLTTDDLELAVAGLEAAVSGGDLQRIEAILVSTIPTFAPNRIRAVAPFRAAT